MKNVIYYPVIFLTFASVISGCSVPHKCKLGENCYNLIDNYEAAKEKAGNKESVIERDSEGKPINPPKDFASKKEVSETSGKAKMKIMGAHNLTKKPVYTPSVPLRIWLAPWRDKDNILHAGEQIYTITKGGWNYGELRSPGALVGSSKVFGPKVTNEVLKDGTAESTTSENSGNQAAEVTTTNTQMGGAPSIPEPAQQAINGMMPGSSTPVMPNPFVSPFSAPGNNGFAPINPGLGGGMYGQ